MREPVSTDLYIEILRDIFNSTRSTGSIDASTYRADHEEWITALNYLEQNNGLKREDDQYRVTLAGATLLPKELTAELFERCATLFSLLRQHYKSGTTRSKPKRVAELAEDAKLTYPQAVEALKYLLDASGFWVGGHSSDLTDPEKSWVTPAESILLRKDFENLLELLRPWVEPLLSGLENIGFSNEPTKMENGYRLEESMDDPLIDLLRRIRDGENDFSPASQQEEDRIKFQGLVRLLKHLEDEGYIEKLRALQESSSGKRYYETATTRGLTYMGERYLEEREADGKAPSANVTIMRPQNTVFIVHGHDNELKVEVQLLLTRAGLGEVVLHEQADRGRTIIQKLMEEGAGAAYVIALFSPDDELVSGDKRARQNVILEVGYFLGKLGNEKVRLLKKGNVEIPSDLHGILYDKYDASGGWKMRLLREINAVGIPVDFAGAAAKL